MNTSTPYSQALRIKRIYSKTTDFKYHCLKTTDFEYHLQELKERLVNQGYNKKSINQQFSKVITIDRNELLKKTRDKETQNKHPLQSACNRFLPNIGNIVRKHWNILNISRALQDFFQKEPITAFKRNRNLKELIESNCIKDGKVKRAKNSFTIGKCSSYLSKNDNLCCSHLTSTATFISQQTKKIEIDHRVSCKMSTLFTWWNAHYIINNMKEKQRLRLTLDWTIIEKFPKIEMQY